MKSYTDIEQSKKLAEILPIESADGFYEAQLRELEQPAMSIDSIRQRHREMRQMRELKNFEDSVHEFEDGF